MAHHAFVHRPCAEASAYNEHGLFRFVQPERAKRLRLRHLGVKQSLAHGVARLHDFLRREEALHAVVGHTDAVYLLGKQLVRNPGIRVLLLYEARHAVLGALVQRGAAGVSAHSHGSHRPEPAYYPPRHALAFPYLQQHGEVLKQILAVEAADWQAYNLIAGSRHALHLHAAERAHKQYVGVGMLGPYGVGDGNGRENMSARTSTADDYP